mgnify:CR=1 FL=1
MIVYVNEPNRLYLVVRGDPPGRRVRQDGGKQGQIPILFEQGEQGTGSAGITGGVGGEDEGDKVRRGAEAFPGSAEEIGGIGACHEGPGGFGKILPIKGPAGPGGRHTA